MKDYLAKPPMDSTKFFRSFERYMDGFRKPQYCPLLLSKNNFSLGTMNLVNADAFGDWCRSRAVVIGPGIHL